MSEPVKRYSSLLYPLIFVILLWAIKLFELQHGIHFSRFGVEPKSVEGLRGILFMPFLHGDIFHLINNSIPVLVLGTTVFFFYREVALKVILWSWLMTNCWVWAAGQPETHHIGASGLIYSMASFVFFSGLFRRYYKLISISLMVVFLYGSMIWGVFPIKPNISWEGHLFGAIAGFFLAFYYRKLGMQKPIFNWEEDEEDGDQTNMENKTPQSNTENAVPVNYIYKPNNVDEAE